MLKNHFHIARLVSGFLMETLSPEEMHELQSWRASSSEHERLFQQICKETNLEKYQQQQHCFDRTEGWQMFDRKIKHALFIAKFRRIFGYVAVILLPLLFIGMFLHYQTEIVNEWQLDNEPDKESILPGERRALLTLGSGEVIDLQTTEQREVNEKDGTTIDIKESVLNYKAAQAGKTSKEIIYNKVEVPRGGEYSLFLADGTKVYLNAMSSLRFPVQFTDDIRQVELDGEAYFEVVKSEKPFIVKIDGMRIEVLGTTFNISSYGGEPYRTTLVSGSVKVATEGNFQTKILKPSQQASFTPGSEGFHIETVDVALYTSWINGKIYFKDERLEDILKNLSRWYDMEVIFEDEAVGNLGFGCNLNRYDEINPFLELLEKTDKVHITQQEKTIIIRTK